MKWVDGNVCVQHAREPWDDSLSEPSQIHCRLDQLNGNWDGYGRTARTVRALYHKAKFKFDVNAAFDLIDKCWNEAAFRKTVKAVMEQERDPIFVFPHLPFDDTDAVGHQPTIQGLPTNALPFAFARILATKIGGSSVDSEILQSARVGRSELGRWLRFLCQPNFTGDVSLDRPYIIVDDVFTTGGTLAALRSYIVRSGGNVIAATTISYKNGVSCRLGVAGDTHNLLNSLYGEGFNTFWKATTGHDAQCITEAEAQFLIGWGRDEQIKKGVQSGDALLQLCRARINKAAANGGE